jgi:hypothetical protein
MLHPRCMAIRDNDRRSRAQARVASFDRQVGKTKPKTLMFARGRLFRFPSRLMQRSLLRLLPACFFASQLRRSTEDRYFLSQAISVPTLIEEIQLVGVCGRNFLRCIVVKQAIDRGFLEQGETQNL